MLWFPVSIEHALSTLIHFNTIIKHAYNSGSKTVHFLTFNPKESIYIFATAQNYLNDFTYTFIFCVVFN